MAKAPWARLMKFIKPERDRETCRQHEQQHAVGDAVEKNGQHDAGPSSYRSSRVASMAGARAGASAAADASRCASRTAEAYFFGLEGSLTSGMVSNSTL